MCLVYSISLIGNIYALNWSKEEVVSNYYIHCGEKEVNVNREEEINDWKVIARENCVWFEIDFCHCVVHILLKNNSVRSPFRKKSLFRSAFVTKYILVANFKLKLKIKSYVVVNLI